jgi:hypothetical protein
MDGHSPIRNAEVSGDPELDQLTAKSGQNVSAFFAKLDRLSTDVAFRASAGGALFI